MGSIDGNMIVLGHRGSAVHRESENTLDAFAAAMQAGAAGVETDVRVTGDGELVLLHDGWLDDFRRVNRLTGWEIDQHRSEQGRAPAVRVNEALAAFPGAVWNLEIKDPGAVPALDELLRSHDGVNVLVTSFHHGRSAAGTELEVRFAPDGCTHIARLPRRSSSQRWTRVAVSTP